MGPSVNSKTGRHRFEFDIGIDDLGCPTVADFNVQNISPDV
jgi:hypothetical protein